MASHEEIERAKLLHDNGVAWHVVAKRMGHGTADYWRNIVYRYRKGHVPLKVQVYRQGLDARKECKPKDAPYPYMSELWAWWVAGWNDWDMRLN